MGASILWARFGPASDYLAKRWPTQQPSVLIVSLPRSGSSWLGDVLGSAANALQLQEPLTQSLMPYCRLPIIELDGSGAEDPRVKAPRFFCRTVADRIFNGVPRFQKKVVRQRQRWALRERRNHRLVIKEVNPLAVSWLVSEYKPKVIYLIRHPAAVASSYHSLGWKDLELDQVFIGDHWRHLQGLVDLSNTSFWYQHGILQGYVTELARKCLAGYSQHRIVLYEDLCEKPFEIFKDLFDFAGLSWSAESERVLREKSFKNSDGDPFGTQRQSSTMIDTWKERVEPADLASLREAYLHFENPFYGPACWD